MEEKLREYAKLLIEVGLNVQKGQTLVISCPVDCAPFARLCASAAYYLAAATGRVYAPATATVGSIGVICRHMDWSGFLEKCGVRVTHLTGGAWKAAGNDAVVVEYSVFKNREMSLAYSADVVLAVLAPLDLRIERAVASGFDEADVRRRIARQITDADRIEASDVVFNNDGTKEELHNKVLAWWEGYQASL